MRFQKLILAGLISWLVSFQASAEIKPIRALLVTGGCCHDYAHQKKILTDGISARANVVWSIVHEGDGTTDHKVSIYDDPDWSKNFDVVVHDECFADVKDAAFVRGILKPHRDGLPAVNLHCAMHCYRVDFDNFKEWFEFTGLDTRSHGAQLPIVLSMVTNNSNSILSGLTNWITVPEELYNNLEIWKTVTPLIYGAQGKETNLVAWINDYCSTRVFSTTLGHNNATVSDARYLDLIARGLLWSVNKLNSDYLKPAAHVGKAPKTVLVPINLAFRKKVSASASQEGHPPEDAVDGDSETRWCAPDNGNNYWWKVDLEKPQEITGSRISWEKENAAYQYKIEGSTDGTAWKTLFKSKRRLKPQMDEQQFSAKEIRYVRIEVTEAPSGSWASFFEFEVLGKEMVEKNVSNSSDPRLSGVQAPAGFEQTYFAGPPNISYPTCLEAAPSGDVFVGVDQNGSLDREKNRGWVVRCRDTNGDGEADDFKTFAKMDSPRGLVFNGKTLYVMHPPLLEAFHDDNGDGVADRSDILVRGLGKDLDFRGADHTCNGVRMGIDGWLYIALGDYGALNAVAKDGSHIQLHGGGIVRVRLDGSDLEVVVEGTRNTYDVAIDPFMNLFTCDNTNDGDDWNLRLSHMISTAHYGYPSLFKNFPRETMATMKDYGGGSPTGALFLDEPGFPDEFGHGLYTCQWGWNNVTRHPLKKSGATFAAEKETFIRVPRPTGIAAGGRGNLFVASWKGATFNYTGPNVGFVLRVSPLNYQPPPFPELAKVSDQQLLELLASNSATRRMHVSQEILRRGPQKNSVKGLAVLAVSSNSLPIRAAAVFTLGQIQNSLAEKELIKLSAQPDLREFTLRVLADSKTAAKLPSKIFVKALEDKNPTVRLQAIIALSRLHRTETAEKIFPFTADNDPAISHAAFRALVSFRAVDVCFKMIDRAEPALAENALRILGNIHEPRVVAELIKRLESSSRLRLQILETLCRLYYREADWDGSWWTTRPDTSGPYYKSAAWESTEKIVNVLRDELATSDRRTLPALVALYQKYKIESPAIPAKALEGLIADAQIDPAIRKRAFQNVARISDAAAVSAIAVANPKEKFVMQLRDDFVRDPQRTKNVETFVKLAGGGSVNESELAYAVLLQVAHNTNSSATSRALARQTIENAKNAVALGRARAGLPQDQTISTSAPAERLLTNLSYEEAVKRASAVPGDPKKGAIIFETASCAKCHTVLKSEAPKGPFLGDITARYNKSEILESILRPSAKIAQGFETTTIELKDAEPVDGFIVRESGDEVEIRNISGATIIPKKNIVERGTRKTSMMPDGLMGNLTPEDLASLFSYLQSLNPKP